MTRGAFTTRAFKQIEREALKAGFSQEAARVAAREAHAHAARVWDAKKKKEMLT